MLTSEEPRTMLVPSVKYSCILVSGFSCICLCGMCECVMGDGEKLWRSKDSL